MLQHNPPMPFDHIDSIVGHIMTEQSVVNNITFSPDTYSPHTPTLRQQMFLDLRNEREVFYGGAAGGGKSDALLMAAAEYVHVPGYAALLFRKTYADLAKPGAIMDRSHSWFYGKAHWSGEKKTWTFPEGGRIVFGYMQTEIDKLRYQSDEYQFIGFDEVTHFHESQFQYMFSRLRKPNSGPLSEVPLRMRAASNPPHDITGMWVKRRFVPTDFRPQDADTPKVFSTEYVDEETGKPRKTYFVPAKLNDNPHIDQQEYKESLSYLDPVTRGQLLRGDWDITVKGDILFDWSERHSVVPWSRFMQVLKLQEKAVPLNWQIGVFQDWGATREHPCVTGWFATAAENCPPVRFRDANGKLLYEVPLAGTVFWYRTHIRTVRVKASAVKREIVNYMVPHNEVRRCNTWQMSHEALSERNEYNDTDDETGISLPFSSWEAGYTRGVEQLKRAIAPRSLNEPHPFNKGVWGRTKLMVLVDDDQLVAPVEVLDGLDRGQSRLRAEAPAYKWDTPKSGEPPAKLRPYPLFNDALDVAREAAAAFWPAMEEMTPEEELAKRVKQRMLDRGVQPDDQHGSVPEGTQIAQAVVRAQEIKRLRNQYDLDEFGFEQEPSDVSDITEGW